MHHGIVNTRHMRAVLASGAVAVYQENLMSAVRDELDRKPLVHARQTCDLGIASRISLPLRCDAGAGDNRAAVIRAHGCARSNAQVGVRGLQRNKGFGRAHRNASTTPHARGRVEFYVVAPDRDGIRRASVHALAARGVAVANGNTPVACDQDRALLQGLRHIRYVVDARHMRIIARSGTEDGWKDRPISITRAPRSIASLFQECFFQRVELIGGVGVDEASAHGFGGKDLRLLELAHAHVAEHVLGALLPRFEAGLDNR